MKQAEGFPVGEYLQDELDARGWTTTDLAERMGGDPILNLCMVDILLACQFAEPDSAGSRVRLGNDCAKGLERAMGIPAESWLNLDEAYHAWREQRN